MVKTLRIIVAVVITLLGVAVIAAIGSRATSNDYVEYWSAGKLFVHGANPYSGPMILALEKSQGFYLDSPLIMLNPPWALLLVAPLGFCPARVGLFLWILTAAGCIAASLLLLDVPPKYRTMAFLFTPVIATFSMQQSSPFLLLGFSLFLRFHRSRPFLAGASLLLMSIKPHLFLVFWAILLADCVYRRSFAIFAGLASALACASAVVTAVVPHVWQYYLALIRGSTLDQNSYPTLPSLFRALIDVHIAWLALVPSLLATIWGVTYFWRRRTVWDWKRHGMLTMLVTVLTSPYSWISDQVVLLPAVASALSGAPRKFSMEILVVINCAALFLSSINSRICMWIPLAWLAWYLYAVGTGVSSDSEEGDSSADSQGVLPRFS